MTAKSPTANTVYHTDKEINVSIFRERELPNCVATGYITFFKFKSRVYIFKFPKSQPNLFLHVIT